MGWDMGGGLWITFLKNSSRHSEGPGPGPGPLWGRAHMGPGPYAPIWAWPIWARVHINTKTQPKKAGGKLPRMRQFITDLIRRNAAFGPGALAHAGLPALGWGGGHVGLPALGYMGGVGWGIGVGGWGIGRDGVWVWYGNGMQIVRKWHTNLVSGTEMV